MRSSLTSRCKRALSAFFTATLVLGLIPSAAFAVEDNGAPAPENTQDASAPSDIQAEAEASAYETNLEDIDGSNPVADASASATGEDPIEDNVTAGDDSNLTIPAATKRINEDVMLTTPVAQQETTRNYFLAQTLESTRTVPIVTAQLPLDKGTADVDIVEPDAEGEGSSASEDEDGESSDDPDSEGNLATTDDSASGVISTSEDSDDPSGVISTEASDSERSGEISSASTVIGSFTYRGITYAVEPGGETVAVVAADYTKLPEDFIEAKAIVLPSMVTADGTDYYSVTRIVDYAFSNLNSNEAGIDAITVPATITEIGDNAYTDFNTLQYIIVSDDNPNYSQYDGCLYDKPQTRLLLIPEGRLGAVRVAPSVTEVDLEVFSHCSSVQTLITDPASAAHQLLQGMDDIDKDLETELDVSADSFICANLGEVGTVDEAAALVQSSLGNTDWGAFVSLMTDSVGNNEVLIRNDSLFAVASLVESSDYSPPVTQGFRAVSNATNAASLVNVTLDKLPTWVRNIVKEVQGSPQFSFYDSGQFDATKVIASSGSEYVLAKYLGRYSATKGGVTGATASSTSVTRAEGDLYSATNPSELEWIYGRLTPSGTVVKQSLRYTTSMGFVGYISSDTNATYAGNKPLLRITGSAATKGSVIFCPYALRITTVDSTVLFNSTLSSGSKMNATKTWIILLPPELKVNWDAKGGTIGGASSTSWLVPTAGNGTNDGIPLSNHKDANGNPIALPKPDDRTGYTFGGWYPNSNGTGTQVTTSTVIYDEGTTFYAKWTPTNYKITLDQKGGSSSTSAFWETYNTGFYSANTNGTISTTSISTIPSPTRRGYTFTGYYEGSFCKISKPTNGGTTLTLPATTTWTANTTLEAHWDANIYGITLKPNGGSGSDQKRWLWYDKGWYDTGTPLVTTTANASITIPTRTGYTFKGYSTDQNATDGTYWKTASGAPDTNAFAETTTLYAIWALAQWWITIDGGGGTISGTDGTSGKTSVTVDAKPSSGDTSVYGASNSYQLHLRKKGVTDSSYTTYTASRTGYTQTGWSDSNGKVNNTETTKNEVLHPAGDGYKVTATWKANTYTLTVNPVGGTISGFAAGKNASYTMTYDTANNYRINNAFTKTGYTFAGLWTEEKGGTQVYGKDGYCISNSTWFSDKNFWKYTDNLTVYAHWDANSYTIKYNGNGSAGGSTADTTGCKYDSDVKLAANGFTRTGYTFNKWNTKSDGTGNAYSDDATATKPNLTSTVNGSATLYATWIVDTYIVVWRSGAAPSASTSSNMPSAWSVVYNNKLSTAKGYQDNQNKLPAPTKWDSDFGGWYTDYECTAGHEVTANTVITNDVVFYAKWTIHKNKLTVNPNGGKLNNKTDSATYDMEMRGWTAITVGDFARTGYSFTGLYTKSSGGEQVYSADGATAKAVRGSSWWGELNSGVGWRCWDSQTAYAQWAPNTYAITLNGNGGSGGTGTVYLKYDTNWYSDSACTSVLGSITAPTRTGYTYKGYSTDSKATAGIYWTAVATKPATNAFSANTALYAAWEANAYTITFDANGGSGGLDKQTKPVTYNSALPKLEGNWKSTAPEGYEFNGWWDTSEKTGGNQYYGPDGEATQTTYNLVADDITLYARWSRLPFHAITLKDERLDVEDGSIWFWPPTKGYTPDDPNGFPVDGTMDHLIRIVAKDDKIVDLTDPIFSDEDYEFLGYFDKKQGDEGAVQKIDADGNLKTDEPITEATVWYAHWTRHGSTVKLAADYGEMVSEDIVQGTEKIDHVSFGKDFATPTGEDATRIETIAQVPTRVGYTFMGYYTEENPELSTDDVKDDNFKGTRWIYGEGEEDVSAGTLVGDEWPSEEEWNKLGLDDKESNAITLYAAWQLDDCIVKFEIEDNLEDDTERVFVPEGSTALDDRIWHYNKNMSDTLPVPSESTFSRNGYDFGGWYYLKDGKTVTRVCDKDGVPTGVLKPWSDPTKNVTLYAYWTPRNYAIQFDPAFPDVEGVERVYEGDTFVEDIKYDDSLTLVSPDFGAYDFAGWYVGVPDGTGGWEASDVPFADWTLRNGTEVKGLHTTAVSEKSAGVYAGRFTPHDPLVGQTYDSEALEPAVIHVVAQWEKPVQRTMRFYAGIPGESVEESKIPAIEEDYDFAKAYDFPTTWLPSYVKDGWKCRGWVEVGTKEAAMELLVNGDQDPEDYAGVTGIEAKVTREDYRDLYFVAKWTICPLSVTLESEGDDDIHRVLATDGFHDEVVQGEARSWMDASKRQSGDERVYVAAYDVRATPFTLPDLARRGYDFKGWRLKGTQDAPVKRLVVDPADQAKLEADHDWVFEPVFEEITYEIVLKPNGGGLEEQTHERTYTQDFTFYCPVALYTGSVFSCWATKEWEPLDPKNADESFRKFHDGMTVSMAPATGEDGEHVFGLTDLVEDGIEHVDDAPRTIILYGIWFDGFIKVDVPLTVNMAIDTETGDVVAAKTPLAPTKENADTVYTVESLHYEPVSTDKGVPFEGANEVYFSIYPGLEFGNETDAYYFLHKDKVGEKGEVTYVSPDGERTATPLLVKLGSTDLTSRLYTRTKLPDDYAFQNMALGDATLNEASGFRSFTYDDPLDVYYGIHFADSATWKTTLQKFAFQENADHWTLPKNDAGNAVNDSEGRKAGWSSDRVDIAKVRYTLSMMKTNQ